MKFFKTVVISIFFLFASSSILYADNELEPFKNAKYVVAKGPEASGVSPFGLVTVMTYDGRCFEYLTDKGQFIKYKACEEKDWVVLDHNFIEK